MDRAKHDCDHDEEHILACSFHRVFKAARGNLGLEYWDIKVPNTVTQEQEIASRMLGDPSFVAGRLLNAKSGIARRGAYAPPRFGDDCHLFYLD